MAPRLFERVPFLKLSRSNELKKKCIHIYNMYSYSSFHTSLLKQYSGCRYDNQNFFLNHSRQFASTGKTYYWANQTPSVYSEEDMQRWINAFPQLKGYAFEDVQKWRNAFDTYDHDKDGFISPADLQKNPNLSLRKVQLLKEYDRDNNNLIDFGEFVEAISALDVIDIRRSFEGFDSVDIQMEFEKFAIQPEGQGKKIMGLPQLKRLMNYCDCICVTDKDASRLLNDMDTGKDLVIDFEEFKAWLYRGA